MKIYIVVAGLSGDDGEVIDRVYSHPDDAETRIPKIFSLQREFGYWLDSQTPKPTSDQMRAWAAENDAEPLTGNLSAVREVRIEERELLDLPTQYIEYCQFDYKVDCRKPNLGAPEPHMRTVADIRDVEIVDGRVRRKPRPE